MRGITLVVSLFALGAPEAMAANAHEAQCLKVLTAQAPNSIPDPADFQGVACPERGLRPAFRHDANRGFVRVARPLERGEIVLRYAQFATDGVRPGQTLLLRFVSGPVQIEREVVALQAARPGQRLFVKAGDGQILSVRYDGDAPQ